MKQYSKILGKAFLLTLALTWVFALSGSVRAAGAAGDPAGSSFQTASKEINKWVKSNGRYYYYNSKGQMLTGIRKIKGKKYYFDSEGRQRTGWINHNGRYYFFKIANGSKGSMVTNRVVNGIKLNSLGRAIYDSRGKSKLVVMVKANEELFAQTNADMKMSTKRWVMFEYTKNHYTVSSMPEYGDYYDWDIAYADFMLFRGYGDCYAFAAVYGYFLNAIGYADPLVVASGGHAWAEVKGYFFDPNWATVIGSYMCYCVPSYLSGASGRPDWARNRAYIKHLNTL